ncbi:hypothetical protein [Pseudonocardia acidicola]|uniref:Uncharacterized protein n=1 Tax=Pseudonocardia acidicola TaxID=2724939 RepID=A0ABX1SH53_9PSEU|nr:hypothetical protein [Pseudonocardia acidicola]NMI00896.1 hypothetical protein [Pseudonocardia acidicola]
MARFRLFGRSTAAQAPPAPWPPDGPSPGYGPPGPGWGAAPLVSGGPWSAPPGGSDAGPDPDGPATRAARPAHRPFRTGNAPGDDTPTDPHGFPPITGTPRPARGASAPAWGAPPPACGDTPMPGPPAGRAQQPPAAAACPGPRAEREPGPHPAEAAALAGAFAVDYLSWDEDDPARRGRVLADYLPVPGGDPARLGWSGRGRQRAEFALPGLVRSDGDGRVLVDVRVRVTPYRAAGGRGDSPAEPEPDIAGVPAAAPAPTGRGWRSLPSYWIRISVPVVLDGGRLVVDAGEETLGEDEPPAEPTVAEPEPTDPTLDDDAPLPERAGGAW